MNKILSFVLFLFIGITYADAAARDNNSINRQKNTNIGRSGTVQKVSDKNNSRSGITNNTSTVTRDTSSRKADNTISRSSTHKQNKASSARSAMNLTSSKSSIKRGRAATSEKTVPTTRNALITTSASNSKTFGSGYNACRDTYFTCMDQFCAKQNETYRRCICSSKLETIKNKERALSQTEQQLNDFKDLNIDAISKTGNEVKAMLNPTTGEALADSQTDTSSSAEKLNGISAVLSSTKSKSLSTGGKLDIAGDINSIWSTTDLAVGADIINLTGEKLYNAVHAQCVSFASESCDSKSILNMVVSAYGMYIENDCSNISNTLNKKITTEIGAIRETEYDMNQARLDNYDKHNSTSINNCIAQVRKDITADSACGSDYIHCLDITGKYLNHNDAEPIYSPIFYQLELQTSLSGDILSNQTNRLLINELNKKKEFAKRGLSTCDDLSDDVWDEFMRQAITEIAQGQQERIRQVKTECIDVVNNCYDSQSKSLKDFSNVKEQLLLGASLELSEEMCQEKLSACSNLYGGGDSGLTELVTTMQNITNQKIAKNCKTTLEEYIKNICTTSFNDTVHSYPFACRTYVPGDQKYATADKCNIVFISNPDSEVITTDTDDVTTDVYPGYICPAYKMYTSCAAGYFMTLDGVYSGAPTIGNRCSLCPAGYTCDGGTSIPMEINFDTSNDECEGYSGSLYQKVVRYALQTCIRPSESNETIPPTILADVNLVMDSLKVSMAHELSTECERLGGIWIDTPWEKLSETNLNYELLDLFYTETSSSTKWGSCVNPI